MNIEKIASILLKHPPTYRTRLACKVDGEWRFCAVGSLLVECGMEPEKIYELNEEAESSVCGEINRYYYEVWLGAEGCLRACGLDSVNDMQNLMHVNDSIPSCKNDELVHRIIAKLAYYTE